MIQHRVAAVHKRPTQRPFVSATAVLPCRLDFCINLCTVVFAATAVYGVLGCCMKLMNNGQCTDRTWYSYSFSSAVTNGSNRVNRRIPDKRY